MASNEGVPYIGSRISLISKKDIRYEGILYNINTKEATVALQTVQSFGTEDRVMAGNGTGSVVVPASRSVYDYVIFNGADIKDLHVCEAANVQALPDDPAIMNSSSSTPPPPSPVPVSAPAPSSTPAPVVQPVSSPSSSQVPSPRQQPSPARATRAQKTETRPSPVKTYANTTATVQETRPAPQSSSRPPPVRRPQPPRQQPSRSHQPRPQGNGMIPGMGGHLLKVKERGVGEKLPESSADGDFDFARCLGGFDKAKEFSQLTEAAPTLSSATPVSSYQKSSFFDTISCDALDRLEGRKSGRHHAAEERSLNTETFGAAGLTTNHRHYGRGRGGRGGRGGHQGGRSHGRRGGGRGRGGRSNHHYGDGGVPSTSH